MPLPEHMQGSIFPVFSKSFVSKSLREDKNSWRQGMNIYASSYTPLQEEQSRLSIMIVTKLPGQPPLPVLIHHVVCFCTIPGLKW